MNNDIPPFSRGNRDFAGPMGFDHHGGAGALGWTIFALQLVLLLGLAVLLVRAFLPAGPRVAPAPPAFARRRLRRGGPGHDPLAVLRLRYARGEISRDEYAQATRDLGGAPAEPPTEDLPPAG